MLGSLLLMTLGCSGISSKHSEVNLQAAYIKNLSPAQKEVLEASASTLLFGHAIKFRSDAFSKSNLVKIERIQGLDERGQPLDGRLVDENLNANSNSPRTEQNTMFIEFSLWLDGDDCWLRRTDTQQQVLVHDVNCSAL